MNYFIGDSHSYSSIKLISTNVESYSIIDNITPVQIKTSMIDFYSHSNNLNNLLYVGFPKIYNFKNFLTGKNQNLINESMTLNKIEQEQVMSLMNHYLIELCICCGVLYQLKQNYKFSLIDFNNSIEDIKMHNHAAFIKYVSTLYNKLTSDKI
jgi:hypothetical protein